MKIKRDLLTIEAYVVYGKLYWKTPNRVAKTNLAADDMRQYCRFRWLKSISVAVWQLFDNAVY